MTRILLRKKTSAATTATANNRSSRTIVVGRRKTIMKGFCMRIMRSKMNSILMKFQWMAIIIGSWFAQIAIETFFSSSSSSSSSTTDAPETSWRSSYSY